jgi:hypothetical protein
MRRPNACLLSLLFLAASACGTDAQGIDACRKIDQARCRRAPSCPELGIAKDQVEACVEFARDQCLHGLAVPDPGAPTVDRCARAIEDTSTSCALVAAPEKIPDCMFLVGSSAPDAGPVVPPGVSDGATGGDD